MAYITSEAATVKLRVNPWSKHPASNSPYDMPERLRNAFYLVNASFFDNVNWYLHRTYELYYPLLKEKVRKLVGDESLNDNEVCRKITNVIEVLNHCNSVIDVRFPVKRESGKWEVVRGFRAQHGLSSGYKSCLGGLRIQESITRDHMKALSILSTYKNACIGIGLAGAHGGLKINSKAYSENELQKIINEYVSELRKKGYCSSRDIVHPDLGSSNREMIWISQIKDSSSGYPLPLAASGKLESYGGFENYSMAGSLGAFLALDYFLHNEEVMKNINLQPRLEGKTFIIQGLGKIGSSLAELLVAKGAVCIGVKEIDGYVYEPKGIDIKELLEYKSAKGTILDYDLTTPQTTNAVYKEPCDILILAGQQNSVICSLADEIKAKIIVEAADGAITPGAHRTLTGKKKLVLPDIYACTGTTVASYLEYLRCLQDIDSIEEVLKVSNPVYRNVLNGLAKQRTFADGFSHNTNTASLKTIVEDTLTFILSDIGKKLLDLASENKLGTDLRTAAYIIAINNIYEMLFSQKGYV